MYIQMFFAQVIVVFWNVRSAVHVDDYLDIWRNPNERLRLAPNCNSRALSITRSQSEVLCPRCFS